MLWTRRGQLQRDESIVIPGRSVPAGLNQQFRSFSLAVGRSLMECGTPSAPRTLVLPRSEAKYLQPCQVAPPRRVEHLIFGSEIFLSETVLTKTTKGKRQPSQRPCRGPHTSSIPALGQPANGKIKLSV